MELHPNRPRLLVACHNARSMGRYVSIYFNDIDEAVASIVFNFANYTKLIRKVASVEQEFNLQEDLQKMFIWSTEWQMVFNAKEYN